MPPSKGCFYLFAAGPGSAPEGLLPGGRASWPGGMIPFKGHYLGDLVDYVDLTAVPLWSRV